MVAMFFDVIFGTIVAIPTVERTRIFANAPLFENARDAKELMAPRTRTSVVPKREFFRAIGTCATRYGGLGYFGRRSKPTRSSLSRIQVLGHDYFRGSDLGYDELGDFAFFSHYSK
jgi:hypothetical protein